MKNQLNNFDSIIDSSINRLNNHDQPRLTTINVDSSFEKMSNAFPKGNITMKTKCASVFPSSYFFHL